MLYCEYMAKDKRLQVRCSKEEIALWQQVAKLRSVSTSEWARQLLSANANAVLGRDDERRSH
jgi:uncharacterized protein (DUF1778 family)